MRFFIDETSDPDLASHLSRIWPVHGYSTYLDESLSGTLDTDLFPKVAERGFDAIITEDRRQLNTHSVEYAALCDSALHWVGHPQVPLPGPKGFALRTAAVIAGFPFVLDELRAADSGRLAIYINGVYRENHQRIKTLNIVLPMSD